MKATLCSSVITGHNRGCLFLAELLPGVWSLSVSSRITSQECWDICHIQTSVGAAHYKLKMSHSRPFNAYFLYWGKVALMKRNLSSGVDIQEWLYNKQWELMQILKKNLRSWGQIFPYPEMSFQFHRDRVVFCHGLSYTYCLSHQLIVKYSLNWKHFQVFTFHLTWGETMKLTLLVGRMCPDAIKLCMSACRGSQANPGACWLSVLVLLLGGGSFSPYAEPVSTSA